MPCFQPLKGWRSKTLTINGKRGIVFNIKKGFADLPITLSCSQCIGCKLERSRQWAIRCDHEASLHSENSFITLTYNDQNLPRDLSLDKTHLQKFWKRLRKKYPSSKIKYYACGEYGDNTLRPHYHAILFNFAFNDQILFKQENGEKLYTSEKLDALWGFGFCTIGTVTFKSAAYVARYILKKITGPMADNHYTRVIENTDPITGEITGHHSRVLPEYATMSLKPTIGKDWINKYTSDVYPSDFVIINNKKIPPPRFYNLMYDRENPEKYKKIIRSRKRAQQKNVANNTPARLKVREKVLQLKLKQLKRNHDN